jgi:oxygen-independent coproporphyrinogen-3 oxidase
MKDYIDWVEKEKMASRSGVPDWLSPTNAQTKMDVLTDIIMTRLRMSDGLNLDWVHEKFDESVPNVVDAILEGAKLGLELGLARREGNGEHGRLGHLKLEDPNGFLFSNSILSTIFLELDADV